MIKVRNAYYPISNIKKVIKDELLLELYIDGFPNRVIAQRNEDDIDHILRQIQDFHDNRSNKAVIDNIEKRMNALVSHLETILIALGQRKVTDDMLDA